MSWTLERPPELLLVEDNEDDVVLARMGLARVGIPVHVHHAPDGVAGLAFLRRQPPYADAPPVDLVLLDLNMPRLDGRGLLAAVAADEALQRLPVVVFTTSASEDDVARMYALRCSGYVVKPLDVDRLFAVLREICTYWFGTVRLPRR